MSHRLQALAGAAVAARLTTACAECVVDTDCPLVQVCGGGACVPAPVADLERVAPADPVGATFDLVVDASFGGPRATLRLRRDNGQPGEPCIPLLERVVVVEGTGDHTTTRVTFGGLPSLGAAFALQVTLESAGAVPVERTYAFTGAAPGDEVGGAVILTPGDDVDVDVTPLVTLTGSVEGRAVAFVAPASAAPSPRRVIADGAGPVAAPLPLMRGPQVVWVETESSRGVRRCGRAVQGLPAGDDGGALDLVMVATAPEPAWVGLTLRASVGGTEAVCNDASADDRCSVGRPSAPGRLVTEQLSLRLDDGVVDVGVLPRIAVGPVQGLVRVTHAGRHVGFFGPFTFLPDEGQSWIAGRVVLSGGVVASASSLDQTTFGAPW
ncbi:MAG: hypothetical protein FJ137_12675 [Deltaproteobacteria bacterium]|nr:hypothetical protein [Deltaproteobacteria bacterium]